MKRMSENARGARMHACIERGKLSESSRRLLDAERNGSPKVKAAERIY
jgi:hypothetical protein